MAWHGRAGNTVGLAVTLVDAAVKATAWVGVLAGVCDGAGDGGSLSKSLLLLRGAICGATGRCMY